ncbi:MAG: hypothetical protein FVQ80_12165 [Planctomycetes bacterium]|nr:hypothetical protein [Planctomycetota bacterium]
MVEKSRNSSGKSKQTIGQTKYELEPCGKYRIDNYDKTPSFSSFLPGIGGLDGVPLWCMYVNRAQAVVSFGVDNKDNPIAEFLPATWAYQLVPIQGFRTFCNVNGRFYEPFQNDLPSTHYSYTRTMWIEPDRLRIREQNQKLGLDFDIEYFSPVNQPLGTLIRQLTISNFSDETKDIDILDGLALIIPAGFNDFGLKSMRRISEAYASVRLVCDKIPFYSTKVGTHDEAEVTKVEKGSFYAAWTVEGEKFTLVEPFVDPDVIFGHGNDLITPRLFIANEKIDRNAQIWENRFTCALAPAKATLKPGQSMKLIAIAGFAPTDKMLADFLPNFKTLQDFENASTQSRELIDDVTTPAFTVSQKTEFDAYSKQNYLDNVLRGGIPHLMPSKSGPTPLHIYSRRHGDLERDYNYFVLPPHPLSSGPGNYRDICQNRRLDILFYPEIADEEIRVFAELLQADGFNPLGIKGYHWTLDSQTNPKTLCLAESDKACKDFCAILSDSFHPGQLLAWLNLHDVDVGDKNKWLNNILEQCDTKLIASGCEGGYWVDHWTYITDLLEAYNAVYPDKISDVLTAKADINFFDEGAYVVPRTEKYVMRSSGPLQLNAVTEGQPSKTLLPPVTVLGKLCALLAIKAVSFDYGCKAIEMEAGRPGWNDSLNGLPGVFGSSTCEAAETTRMANWLLQNLKEIPDTTFPTEVADFIQQVLTDLQQEDYCWNRAADIREKFRAAIRKNVTGNTKSVTGDELQTLLKAIAKRADQAVKNSVDQKTSLMHTYYTNEPLGFDPENLAASIKKFEQKPMPLYLEGQVHYLRLLDSVDDARKVYKSVKKSPLFDKKLQMYKINECLDECPPEIGRARTFTRGWFENESIWTHMSYKYLLELLRAGLYTEFYEDAKTMLVPFMKPEIYGRSILENSSFIASSANPDPATHGRGFVARLSGSTAEFIHISMLMTIGQNPFYIEDEKLNFVLAPAIPGDWFTTKQTTANFKGKTVDIAANSFACALLGDILLVYHNESRKDTFGDSAVKPVKYVFDTDQQVDNTTIGPELAHIIRDRRVNRIDVYLQ